MPINKCPAVCPVPKPVLHRQVSENDCVVIYSGLISRTIYFIGTVPIHKYFGIRVLTRLALQELSP